MRWPAIPDPKGVQSLALLMQLEGTQWWSHVALKTAQFKQLSMLLTHAYRHSVMYREYLDTHNYQPGMQIDMNFRVNIQILKRRTLLERSHDIRSTQCPDGHGQVNEYTLSGSTGVAVSVFRTDLTGLFYLPGFSFSGDLVAFVPYIIKLTDRL